MKILITGGAGFIGTHVRKRLSEHDISIIDAYEERVHGFDAARDARYCAAVTLDDLHDVEVIIHLAAQVGVADSMTDPLRYVTDNTWDTAAFLDKLRRSGVRPRRLIVASSMSVYGDPRTSSPITEDHPIRPASVYGLTKFDQEQLCLMYGEMLGISTAALRFFNVYGPGQALTNPYTGVLAIFANAFLNGETPTVYEDGLQTRDFIYVEDIAEAVARMALNEASGIFNVCTGLRQTVLGASHALSENLLGTLKLPRVTHTSRPGDIRHCVGSNARLREALPGWEPRTFEEGIALYTEALKARV